MKYKRAITEKYLKKIEYNRLLLSLYRKHNEIVTATVDRFTL